MFLGDLVESSSVDEIFSNPSHDYTKKLLKAIPITNPKGREERKNKRLSEQK